MPFTMMNGAAGILHSERHISCVFLVLNQVPPGLSVEALPVLPLRVVCGPLH